MRSLDCMQVLCVRICTKLPHSDTQQEQTAKQELATGTNCETLDRVFG